MNDPRDFLQRLFDSAVRSAQPAAVLAEYLPKPPRGRTIVVGAGKASGAMARVFDSLWPAGAPLEGLVVTRYGHTPPRESDAPQRIEIVEAAHPVPDEAGRVAAGRMLEMVKGLTADDLVVCLISGGGSSLLTLPAEGLDFADKQRINQQLLLSGANISEMNCVRKHMSSIKGGRLAAACSPAKVVTLAISDVPGDDVSTIASGPTVADDSTCEQALEILRRYGIAVPLATEEALRSGSLETPKQGDPCFDGNETYLIATPQRSLEAAAEAANAAGVNAYILSDEVEGESRDVGMVHAALARSVAKRGEPFPRPCVILSGGETTVTVRPREPGQVKGKGGRAGEFCMGLAQALQGCPGIWALAADTDGIDGVEDNAGAFVTPDTLIRGLVAGHKLADHLNRNDSYGYFSAIDDLLITGPTYTNVNDFRAILIA
ncbi:glycerate kinase type-2 family protein [Cupriavidus numazuensis]|uniref:Hydroxypyruvate reductase n=1 Tax=Cupriavidus numazuensis TaxID=221992 RepID=A0ABN7Q562_9BURK|nr:glycerate kinase [Cupriavidus numazuensis]CAG2154757.1 Putative hydroxypyruvate reductase [Cupriavidus numazuensis]